MNYQAPETMSRTDRINTLSRAIERAKNLSVEIANYMTFISHAQAMKRSVYGETYAHLQESLSAAIKHDETLRVQLREQEEFIFHALQYLKK